MNKYRTLLDCMIFTETDSPKTISLEVWVSSEEELSVSELSVFASRECKNECINRELEFYGFRIMRVVRYEMNEINFTFRRKS